MEAIKKTFFLLFSFTVLVACDQQKDKNPNSTFRESTDRCRAEAIENYYIAKWKDGSTERVYASSKDALLNDFIALHEEDLEYVEAEVKIVIPAEPIINDYRVQFSPANWQHAAIKTQAAWSKGIYGQGVTVAVIDSGLDVNHPQLSGRIAINHGEIPNNAIDDDGNGFVDDYLGYDFFYNSPHVQDPHGHGTHVAGIVAAEHINANLPMGVSPQAKILPLSFMNERGEGTSGGAIAAIKYAKLRGAKIINASWGSSECSLALKEIIKDAVNSGILFVAAAGNNGMNIDVFPSYPSSFLLPKSLSVAASTVNFLTADFSNYSRNAVHIAAPGRDILSTYRNGSTAILSGTSMSAPIVSGIAALIWSHEPNLSLQEVHTKILNSVKGKFFPVISGGEVTVEGLFD